MTNNINFTELWASQKTTLPNQNELISKMNSFKKNNLRKLIITNLLLIATSIFILFIWFYFEPQMIITKLGILLTILAMALFVIAYNQSFALFKNTSNTLSNSDYLKNLLLIKAKQHFMQTTMLNLYFVLLSTGIGLYMYEYVIRMTIFWGFLTCGITAIWVLFNWFYIRPKQIKKQTSKLDDIIAKFEMFNNQLKEE